MEKLEIPVKIETKRLLLKKHSLEDAAIMFSAVSANRKIFEEVLPWVKPTKNQADTEAFIKASIKDWEESTGFGFSIFVKETNIYIGNLGLHTLSLEHLRGEFGYWLDASAHSQGYMTEAVEAFEGICFAAGLNRLEIRCAPTNEKSAGIPKKLNYQLDGRLRDNFMVSGRVQDTLVFSKIRADLKR